MLNKTASKIIDKLNKNFRFEMPKLEFHNVLADWSDPDNTFAGYYENNTIKVSETELRKVSGKARKKALRNLIAHEFCHHMQFIINCEIGHDASFFVMAKKVSEVLDIEIEDVIYPF